MLCDTAGRILAADDAAREALASAGGLVDGERCRPLTGEQAFSTVPPVLRVGARRFEAVPVRQQDSPCVLLACNDESDPSPSGVGLDATRFAILRGYYEGIVHDLRSPLNSIAMNAEMLRYTDEPDRDQEVQRKRRERYTQAIGAEVQRLSNGVSTLVEFLALEDGGSSTTSVAWLSERVRRFAAPALRGWQTELRTTGAALDAPVTGDAGQLQLALLGAILMLEPGTRPGTTITLRADYDADAVALSVSLDGAGPAAPGPLADANLVVTAARLIAANGGVLETGTWGEAGLGFRLPASAST